MGEMYGLHLLHLLAAMVWVGGSLMIPLVVAPVLRRRFPPEQRTEMLSAIGLRFRPFAWIALLILVLTGVRRAAILFSASPDPWQAFSETPYGRTLMAKLILVLGILLFQALHDFVLGPRMRALASSQDAGLARLRAATIGLAFAGLLMTLGVVTLAAMLRFR
jgi:uncharacterized membrane protein